MYQSMGSVDLEVLMITKFPLCALKTCAVVRVCIRNLQKKQLYILAKQLMINGISLRKWQVTNNIKALLIGTSHVRSKFY